MMPWQPSADIKQLKQRAKIISQIRDFFANLDVLEVDTPVMSHYGVSDPHIDSIPVDFGSHSFQCLMRISSDSHELNVLTRICHEAFVSSR